MTLPTITDAWTEDELFIVIVNFFFKYTFNRSRLEKWLDDNGLFSWISDTERGGEHYQESGEMDFNEWYESRYFDEDIIKAIEKLNVEPEQIQP